MFNGRITAPGAPAATVRSGGRRHTLTAFDDDLVGVSTLTSQMGGRAEELLAMAMRSIEYRDMSLARQVAAKDRRLDELERTLSSRAASVLALRHPVAGDLRMLLASLRIAASLERIGNLARNTAARGEGLGAAERDDLAAAVLRLGARALSQLAEALTAHQRQDAERARAVALRDAELDAHFSSVTRALVERMAEGPGQVDPGAQWLFIAKNLERAGDHAASISEATYYMVSGEPLPRED